MTIKMIGDIYPVSRSGFQPMGMYDQMPASDIMKTTKLQLIDEVVPFVSITTGLGEGGKKIWTFPPGFIRRGGARALLTLSIAAAKQADYTDGDFSLTTGVGTAVISGGDTAGTTATDDNWLDAAAIALVGFVSPATVLAPVADAVHDGSTTPVSLWLNMSTPAADIDDATTTEVVVNGYIWFSWINQGGVAAY